MRGKSFSSIKSGAACLGAHLIIILNVLLLKNISKLYSAVILGLKIDNVCWFYLLKMQAFSKYLDIFLVFHYKTSLRESSPSQAKLLAVLSTFAHHARGQCSQNTAANATASHSWFVLAILARKDNT